MKKLLISLFIFPAITFAGFNASINQITPQIKQKMLKGNSYRNGCPIALKDLRYIQLKYIGFDNKEHTGELVVNKSISKDIVSIFKKLYESRYPIKQMRLVSNFGGSDFKSIEADNTSAFNCRYVDGTHKWSNHTYGKAIDINPIENPYVSNSGHTSHKKSYPYLKRNHSISRAVMIKSDYIVKLFKAHGFRWGGDWRCCKDYQHFDKK